MNKIMLHIFMVRMEFDKDMIVNLFIQRDKLSSDDPLVAEIDSQLTNLYSDYLKYRLLTLLQNKIVSES